MVGQTLAVAVLSALLGAGPPGGQSGDPMVDEWELPPELPRQPAPEPEKPPEPPAKAPARSRPLGRKPNPSFSPPDPRLERVEVIAPALVGVGLGLGSGVFYKLALDQHAALESGGLQTRGEVIRTAQTGATHQTISVVLGSAALASVGVAAVMYFIAPETKPTTPKLTFLPGPNGVLVGFSGVLP